MSVFPRVACGVLRQHDRSYLIAWDEPQECFQLPLAHILGKASHKDGPDFVWVVVAGLGRVLVGLRLSIGWLRLGICWRRCLACYRLRVSLYEDSCRVGQLFVQGGPQIKY